jgi:hypothetical protein
MRRRGSARAADRGQAMTSAVPAERIVGGTLPVGTAARRDRDHPRVCRRSQCAVARRAAPCDRAGPGHVRFGCHLSALQSGTSRGEKGLRRLHRQRAGVTDVTVHTDGAGPGLHGRAGLDPHGQPGLHRRVQRSPLITRDCRVASVGWTTHANRASPAIAPPAGQAGIPPPPRSTDMTVRTSAGSTIAISAAIPRYVRCRRLRRPQPSRRSARSPTSASSGANMRWSPTTRSPTAARSRRRAASTKARSTSSSASTPTTPARSSPSRLRSPTTIIRSRSRCRSGDVFYMQAQVMSFKTGVGSVDNITNASIKLELTTSSAGVGIVEVLALTASPKIRRRDPAFPSRPFGRLLCIGRRRWSRNRRRAGAPLP